MKTSKFVSTLCFFISIGLLGGCFRKPQSVGGDTELVVIADEANWQVLEEAIREVFERVIETPQPEKVFSVHWVAPEEHQNYLTRKNIILIGILGSEGQIDEKVASMLSPQVKAKVEAGEAFYLPKEDAYAENQLLMVLAGTSVAEVEEKLNANKARLYDVFKEELRRDTFTQMYDRMEQKDLEQELLQKYGWMVRIQHDYVINVDRADDNFVMLRRSLPGRERWLFVHWLENAEPSLIDQQWMIETRNRLTQKYYAGDAVVEEYSSSQEVEFSGRAALKLEGLWENNEKRVGGPFRTYAFYDEPSDRIYMIDIAVFYPAGQKEPFLRQLDIMAHTFKTAREVEESKFSDES